MLSNEQYEYWVLAAMLQSGEAVARVLPLYRATNDPKRGESWFTNQQCRFLANAVVNFVLKHSPNGNPPSRSYLIDKVQRAVTRRFPDRPTDTDEVREKNEAEREALLALYDRLLDRYLHLEVETG